MYEYKCVGAPERARRAKGAKTRTDRVAHAMQDMISAEAVDGWEYLRTDLLPVEEKAGLFSRARETHRAVLIFRRSVRQERVVPQDHRHSIEADEPMPAPAVEAHEGTLRIAASNRAEPALAGEPRAGRGRLIPPRAER